MKRFALTLAAAAMCTTTMFAQNPNKVYISSKSPKKIELPAERLTYGGSIINIEYKGSRISTTIKGAFEYACKLVEECMPTVYPLNISVEFSNLQDDNCLALVESYPAIEEIYWDGIVDKVFIKRYAQVWGDYLSLEDKYGLDFFRDSFDASIKFSANKPFDFNLDTSRINANKYDFVTVAIQSLLKAIGFTCKAYATGNQVAISSPANKYTLTLLNPNDAGQNYATATSGNAYIPSRKSSTTQWDLVSDAPYKPGISLNYFTDSSNQETAIMQYGIPKGAYIRYIGSAIQDFFSFCEWNRPVITGGDNLNIQTSNTKNVIKFQGISKTAQTSDESTYMKNQISKLSETETFASYMSAKQEVSDPGTYVLLKDGSWEKYERLTNLSNNEKYARSADGYLRLKEVSTQLGLGGQYYNHNVKYQLYDYLPQKPEATLNSYTASTDFAAYNNLKRTYSAVSDDDIFIDVEIGIKNIEGTTQVMVEQTDSDYPYPYTYAVEKPSDGKFIAYMNQKYPSTFKLTYLNANGQTIGDTFTIDLTSNTKSPTKKSVEMNIGDNDIAYHIKEFNNNSLNYVITNVTNGRTINSGQIKQKDGAISISTLDSGIYIITIYNKEEKITEMKWVKK